MCISLAFFACEDKKKETNVAENTAKATKPNIIFIYAESQSHFAGEETNTLAMVKPLRKWIVFCQNSTPKKSF